MSIITSTSKDAPLEVREPAYVSVGKQQVKRAKRARSSNPRTVGHILSTVPPLALAVLLLISWYISTASGHVSSLFLPAPADVFASLASGLSSGLYLSNTLVTVQESVVGFLLALVVALPLGYGVAKSRVLASIIQPYVSAGQAIPAIVIAPLLVLWFGYGLFPNVLVCMLVVLFPMVINTILGMQTIDRTLLDAARVEGASGWSLLAHIEFPLALPAVLAAVRTGFTLSITGALVAEFVQSGDQGLGSLLMVAKTQYDSSSMFATLIVLAVLAALYYAVTWLPIKLAEIVY